MRFALSSFLHFLSIHGVALAVRVGLDDLELSSQAAEYIADPSKMTSSQMYKILEESKKEVAAVDCDDFNYDYRKMLARTTEYYHTLRELNTGSDDHFRASPGNESQDPFYMLAGNFSQESIFLMSLIEHSWRKRCLLHTFNNSKDSIAPLLAAADLPSVFEDEDLHHVWSKLVMWQHGVVKLNDTALLYDALQTTDIEGKYCPSECDWCSREPADWRPQQSFTFRCVLKRVKERKIQVLYTPADSPEYGSEYECTKPERRYWRRRQWQTWCDVPDWKTRVKRQAQIAAVVGCSIPMLQPGLQKSIGLATQAHLICLKVERGVAVQEWEYDFYNRIFTAPKQGTMTSQEKANAAAFQFLTYLGVGSGIASLMQASAPSEEFASRALEFLEPFQQGFSTEGADDFFDLDAVNKLVICRDEYQGSTAGFFGIGVRNMLRFLVFPIIFPLMTPFMFYAFFMIFRWLFREAIPLGILAAVTGTGLVWAAAFMKVAEHTFYGIGQAFGLTPWDCASSAVNFNGEEKCIEGNYWGRSRKVQCPETTQVVRVRCEKKRRGVQIYDNPCIPADQFAIPDSAPDPHHGHH